VYFDAARAAAEPEGNHLRRKAGLLLLAGGHEQESVELLAGTIESLGVSLSQTREQAREQLVTLAKQLRARGLGFTQRAEGELSSARLERMDTLFALTLGMVLTDVERSLPLVVRVLLEALELGEPQRVISALCLYHSHVDAPACFVSGRAPAGALAIAEALDRAIGTELAHARVLRAQGIEALALGEVRAAVRYLTAAEELHRTRCPGTAPEMRHCRALLSHVLMSSGQIERLGVVNAYLREAEEHDDVLAATRFRLLRTLSLLAADEADHAERELQHAVARLGRERLDATFVVHDFAAMQIALYRGDAAACAELARTAAGRARVFASIPLVAGDALLLRARVALLGSRAAGVDAEALRAEAERAVERAAELELPGFGPRLALLRAGLDLARGAVAQAMDALDRVIEDAGDAPDAMLVRAAAERRTGELVRGELGIMKVARSDQRFREHDVRDPKAFARLFVP
jgi:hypothetical protein